MKNIRQKLLIEQADRKVAALQPLAELAPPPKGWIAAIRTALRMSLRQLGERLGISAQSVKELEQREVSGAITLNSLKEAARAMDMKLVYGFVPKEESLEKMIEKKAYELAEEIVMRTSQSMKLEDQEVSYQRLKKSIKDKADEIKTSMPRHLWD